MIRAQLAREMCRYLLHDGDADTASTHLAQVCLRDRFTGRFILLSLPPRPSLPLLRFLLVSHHMYFLDLLPSSSSRPPARSLSASHTHTHTHTPHGQDVVFAPHALGPHPRRQARLRTFESSSTLASQSQIHSRLITVCESLRPQHTAIVTVNLALTRTIGATLVCDFLD